jgi:hypothetical protein
MPRIADRLRCNATLLRMMANREVPMHLRDLASLSDDLDAIATAIERPHVEAAEIDYRIKKARAA